VNWQLNDTYFVVAHLHFVLIGGAVFGIFAGVYYWFPKITGRLLSEGLGRVSFGLMFVGTLTTFLIQHSLGLDGMPRRVYEYDTAGRLEPYNQTSPFASSIPAPGVIDPVVTALRPVKRAPVAGPAPWLGNPPEWYPPPPPPQNNFDAVP